MFEFAISQQKRHTPSRRTIASWIGSCLAHLLAIEILIAYPSLLGPGLAHWFRSSRPGKDANEERIIWRTVAVLRSPTTMEGPSAATLRANTYDWAKAARDAMTAPPIHISWKNEPKPKGAGQPPGPPPSTNEPAESAQRASEAAAAASAAAAAAGGAAQQDVSVGPGRVVYLPAPAPDVEPRQIPKQVPAAASATPAAVPPPAPKADTGKQPPPPTAPPQQASAGTQVFENKQQALQSEGSGFFDTKGFPLGQYATAVIERVKGNWSIPSNLRNSRGRTTVVFFIGKDGRYTGAQIVKSSGITSLDLAALNAVLISNPFPPLPPDFPATRSGRSSSSRTTSSNRLINR